METPLSPFTSASKGSRAEELFVRYRTPVYLVLAILLGIGIYMLINPPKPSLAGDPDAIPTDEIASQESGATPTTNIVVDISGGVISPGVYLLPSGSIVEDAIKAAGGFSRLVDPDSVAKIINRAALVDSHSKIYIPKKGDSIATISPTGVVPNQSATSANSTKININTATATELDVLPGIGPVTAQRIIDYRIQNGDFETIEDIKNVSGISDAKFDQLKDLITI